MVDALRKCRGTGLSIHTCQSVLSGCLDLLGAFCIPCPPSEVCSASMSCLQPAALFGRQHSNLAAAPEKLASH